MLTSKGALAETPGFGVLVKAPLEVSIWFVGTHFIQITVKQHLGFQPNTF